ncbi:hypothetical protein WP50_32125, partial [Lactiplantibacillus plantarum]
ALQVLCEKLSLTAANVMAIGDEANDLSMIKFGVDRFGTSAPGDLVLDKYGFNVTNVVNTYLKLK